MKRKVFIIINLILVLMILIPIKSNAIVPIESTYIYSKGKTEGLLMWEGLKIHTYIAVYKNGGKEYPAYCLNRDLAGVELGTQTVDINSLVSDVMVWRAVINGYPYKSISQLGCKTEGEAYLATKQAVYCMLTNRDPNTYTAIGESGERTLNALKKIVSSARSSKVTKVSSNLTIKQEDSLWKIDSLDNKYISQVFDVTSNACINKYNVKIENLNVEGLKITDVNNNEKKEFKSNEKFKILIPTNNIIEDGSFNINVSGQVETKPVLFAKSKDSSLQNYAIAGYTYEDGVGNKKVYYTKNETKIIVIKKDDIGKNNLKGVEFQLLDNNKNVIYTDLITNENGKIEINNLLPGTYYIKETKTLEGYKLYDKLIKVDVDLNETIIVNVINSQDKPEIETEKKSTELSIDNKNDSIQVKLPKTGM